MTNDRDARLGALLRQHAPAERDPYFRLQVLARGERQLQQRRLREVSLLAGAALVVLALGATSGTGLLESAGCLLLLVGAFAVFKHASAAFRQLSNA